MRFFLSLNMTIDIIIVAYLQNATTEKPVCVMSSMFLHDNSKRN